MFIKRYQSRNILTKIGLSGAVLMAPLFLSQTALAAPKDAYITQTGTGTDCSQISPCGTFADAMAAVGKGGTIHVGDGSYTEDINVTKNQISITADNPGQVIVTTDNTNSWGVTIEQVTDVTITGINFVVAPGDTNIAYALHAHNAKGLSLQNDNFKALIKALPTRWVESM